MWIETIDKLPVNMALAVGYNIESSQLDPSEEHFRGSHELVAMLTGSGQGLIRMRVTAGSHEHCEKVKGNLDNYVAILKHGDLLRPVAPDLWSIVDKEDKVDE
jgi:hypothetical protein